MSLLALSTLNVVPLWHFYNHGNLYGPKERSSILHCITLSPFGDCHIIFGLIQYTTYEDCVKEASMLVGKCRGSSNHSQLEIDINNICDNYAEQLKNLCSANCAKGKLHNQLHYYTIISMEVTIFIAVRQTLQCFHLR